MLLNQDAKRTVKGPVWTICKSKVSAVFLKVVVRQRRLFSLPLLPPLPPPALRLPSPLLYTAVSLGETRKGGGDWHALFKGLCVFLLLEQSGKVS